MVRTPIGAQWLRIYSSAISVFLLYSPAGFCADQADEPLGPVAFLSRCYSHLTSRRLPVNHPERAAILNKTSTPAEACLRILDKANLLNSGANTGRIADTADVESKAVLATMNDFHRTWFPRDSFVENMAFGNSFRSERIHDEGEAGLHLTRALFSPGVKYQEVVTGETALEALRSSGGQKNEDAPDVIRESVVVTSESIVSATNIVTGSENKVGTKLATEWVQTGELWGVRSIDLNPRKRNLMASSARESLSTPGPPRVQIQTPIHSLGGGGGILGAPSYFLLNQDRLHEETNDGGVKLYREWSKSVMSDLLCRGLPVVRVSDAVPFVQATPGANTPPYRTAATCMSCHASIDPFASVMRNLRVTIIPSSSFSDEEVMGRRFAHAFKYAESWPREAGQVDSDNLFHLRPPNGRFYYRDINGVLHNEPVLGVRDLGTVISGIDDLYVCAASRYFKFFTGIEVGLYDPGDASAPSSTPGQKRYQDFVYKLGRNLKSHQSLRDLIKEILESPYYGLNGMREFIVQ